MSKQALLPLYPRMTQGAKVVPLEPDGWHLEIPGGKPGRYRLAQLDDYSHLARSKFNWNSPLCFHIKARASSNKIPGTWGFGFWNDPFGISMGVKGSQRKFPTLPNCAWFFMASPPNILSLYDQIPGQGNLVNVFRSTRIPLILKISALFGIPFLTIPSLSRTIRKWARRYVKQEGSKFTCDLEAWHDYRIVWEVSEVRFLVDDRLVFQTALTPRGPLGLVIWIDNQYASWTGDGKIGVGTLVNPEAAWIELSQIEVE